MRMASQLMALGAVVAAIFAAYFWIRSARTPIRDFFDDLARDVIRAAAWNARAAIANGIAAMLSALAAFMTLL